MSFVVDTALGMLGLTDDQKATVEAQIPNLNNTVQLISENMGLFNQLFSNWQEMQPAVQIVMTAVYNQYENPQQFIKALDRRLRD